MSTKDQLLTAVLRSLPSFGAQKWEMRVMARRAARIRQAATVHLCEHRVLAIAARKGFDKRHGG